MEAWYTFADSQEKRTKLEEKGIPYTIQDNHIRVQIQSKNIADIKEYAERLVRIVKSTGDSDNDLC